MEKESTRKIIRDKTNQELKKSLDLRYYSSDQNISFDKAQEINKKQDEAFKKFQFFKKLSNAMNEVEK